MLKLLLGTLSRQLKIRFESQKHTSNQFVLSNWIKMKSCRVLARPLDNKEFFFWNKIKIDHPKSYFNKIKIIFAKNYSIIFQ